jgi:hypothetical protein
VLTLFRRAMPVTLCLAVALSACGHNPSSSPGTAQSAIKTAAACGSAAFPDPYSAVNPCDQDEVSCAALSALFTWIPGDTSPATAYTRTLPLIADGGLHYRDGAPQNPFAASSNPDETGSFDVQAAWKDLTDSRHAFVAYTTRHSQGATSRNALFETVQYAFKASDVDDHGSPKPSAVPQGPAWNWAATVATTQTPGDNAGFRISYVFQYSPGLQTDTSKWAPGTRRWACQTPNG